LADINLMCAACGTSLPPEALACPSCHQLAHAQALEDLARQAREREAAGAPFAAAQIWKQALELLPPESSQAAVVRDRIASLGATARLGDPARKPVPNWLKRFGPLGAAAFAFFGKIKFLLLGLGKIKTVLTMLASMGLYWTLYGWRFGIGFVLGIYIHEMGHVWALHRFGLRASTPMFVPGLGAFISLYDSPANVAQDARIGLAGPLWGAAAAIAFLIPGSFLHNGMWLALARATAMINLFNLTPVWQLDGGRAFRALDRQQRMFIGVLLAALWYVTGQGMLLILLAGAAYRIFWSKDPAPSPDWTIFLQFSGLALLFAALMFGISIGPSPGGALIEISR